MKLAAVLTIFAVTACASSEVTSYVEPDDTGTVQMTTATDLEKYRADALTIDSAYARSDMLHVFVTHGGGCRTHEYAAVSSGAWMESHPVQLAVAIAHDANGDVCKALLREHVRFDLARIRDAYRRAYQTRTGEIVLQLAPLATPAAPAVSVRYTF